METATLVSLIFNFILLGLLLYFDWSRRSDGKNKDEVIKDLSLKVISRTTVEYMQASGKPAENTPEVESPFVDLEEADPEKLVTAEI